MLTYKCATYSLNANIKKYKYEYNAELIKWVVIAIFSAIGLIIGLGIGISGGIKQGWPSNYWLVLVIFVYVFVGILGNLGIALADFPILWRISKDKDGEESFFGKLAGILFFAIIFLCLKSFLGPIFPIKRIWESYTSAKTCKSLVAYDTETLKKWAESR